MLDAIQLSKRLQAVQDSITSASYTTVLSEYAAEMVPRASKAVLESREAAVNMVMPVPEHLRRKC
jgi:hypothetical protein